MNQLDRPRKKRITRNCFIDSLESRLLMATTPEFRWMIQQAGGVAPASPNLTVGSNLAASGGYAKTTTPNTAVLSGVADAAVTASVKVNGVAATYTAATGAWTLTNTNNAINLKPGINAVQVRSYNASSAELTHKVIDVWYDDGSVVNVSGSIAGNTTWTAAGGPYLVTGSVTIPSGSTLTIEAGTSVYFASATRLTINGTLNAQGNDLSHIRLTRDPTGAATWGGISFSSTGQSNKLAYADVSFAGNGGSVTVISGSKADVDHVVWSSPVSGAKIYDVTGTSTFSMTNCVVPSTTNSEPTHFAGSVGAYAIVQGSAFGTVTGHNDVIDFTGGNRPGTIIQILDNWFTGTGPGFTSSDDILDLDGTDVHVEGNVFMNVKASGTSDTNSAISGGGDAGNTSEIVSTRNFFYNVDHGFLMKEGNSVTSINDTFVHVITGVFNFDEPGFAASAGSGGRAVGDVFYDVPMNGGSPIILQNPPTGTFTVSNSIAGGTVVYPGTGNILGDPLLANTAAVVDPRDDFKLLPGSPAIGKGPNGTDMGAAVPKGVSFSGEPAAHTNLKNASIIVGTGFGTTGTATAANYTAYKYRLNEGPYGAETPIGTPITLTNLADGTYAVYAVGKNDAGVYQTEAEVSASKTWVVDTKPPKVSSAVFNYQLAAQTLAVAFNEDVNVTKAGLLLTNVSNNTTVDSSNIALSYDAGAHAATLTFPGFADGRLPDGNYRLTLSTIVRDLANNQLDGNGDGTGGDNYTFDFFSLAGDANHDRAIDFGDLVIVAQNYGKTGKTFAEGDLDFDGSVGFGDLVLIAQKYGTVLGAPAGTQPVGAESVLAPVRAETPVIKAVLQPRKQTVRAAKRVAPVFAKRRI